MTGHWSAKFWRSAAQVFLGGIGLALLTFVCFRLGLSPAKTGYAYLIVIVPPALMGSVIASVVFSIVAAGCLNYFFTQPLFTFRVDYPQDLLAIAAFLTVSLVVNAVAAKARKQAEEAQASQKALIDTIPALVWSALPDGSHDFHSRRWLEYSGLSAAEAAGMVGLPQFIPKTAQG